MPTILTLFYIVKWMNRFNIMTFTFRTFNDNFLSFPIIFFHIDSFEIGDPGGNRTRVPRLKASYPYASLDYGIIIYSQFSQSSHLTRAQPPPRSSPGLPQFSQVLYDADSAFLIAASTISHFSDGTPPV